MRIHELFGGELRDDHLSAYIDMERIPPDLLRELQTLFARQEVPAYNVDLLQVLYGQADDDRRDRLELDLLSLDVRLRRAEVAAKLADAIKTRADTARVSTV
ncbi:hypothetical protein [Microvirga soli]|uniref:hypothetical protein n=1 Tax=Microvirga soli TaxID=1854496 RepID=UPI00191EAFC2|nr:hypothetical protein [Microvirga soli]